MPTGCRSVYLSACQYTEMLEGYKCGAPIPAGDLESRTKDLSTYKFGHSEVMAEAA